MDEKLILAAADEIRNYLAARPDSADTVEGIHQWWIRWPGFPEPIIVTQAALEMLQEAGIVECVQYGNRMLWRRARDKDAASDH